MISLDNPVSLLHGDVADALLLIPDNCIDAVCTDPPYALDMGGGTKGWDSYGARAFAAWCESWAAEALRVAKPGAWMVAAGSARTAHRLTQGIEDAGWEIVDVIDWLYSSSFHRAVNLEARLTKNNTPERIQEMIGRATYVKSRREPFVLARAPMSGGLTNTIAEWGTATLDVTSTDTSSNAGPSNVVVSHDPQCEIGGLCVSWCAVSQLGPNGHLFPAFYWSDKPSSAERPRVEVAPGEGTGKLSTIGELRHWKCRVCGVLTQSYMRKSQTFSSVPHPVCPHNDWVPLNPNHYADEIAHNTVKPLSLMRWLIRLISFRGGLILEPFAGSGSTVEAAVLERRRIIAVERDASSIQLVQSRLRRAQCRRVDQLASV
jgi:DNA modification methylase